MGEKTKMRRPYFRRLLDTFMIVAVLFVGTSWFFGYKLIGARTRPVGSPPAEFPFPIENVSWTTGDGETIKGWLVPAGPTDPAIILVHGYVPCSSLAAKRT